MRLDRKCRQEARRLAAPAHRDTRPVRPQGPALERSQGVRPGPSNRIAGRLSVRLGRPHVILAWGPAVLWQTLDQEPLALSRTAASLRLNSNVDSVTTFCDELLQSAVFSGIPGSVLWHCDANQFLRPIRTGGPSPAAHLSLDRAEEERPVFALPVRTQR